MLGRMAESAAASRELTKALAQNPPWRASFSTLSLATSPTHAPRLQLLLDLRNTATPPRDAERRSYLEALVQHKLYELAYYSWLQFLPQEQLSKTGRLFNGSFASCTFWSAVRLGVHQRGRASISSLRSGRIRASQRLLIEFGPGRVDFASGLSELVLLPAGTYKLEGKYKADLVSQRGLQWSVNCVDTNRSGRCERHDEWIRRRVEGYRSLFHHSPRWVPRSICHAEPRCEVSLGAVRFWSCLVLRPHDNSPGG